MSKGSKSKSPKAEREQGRGVMEKPESPVPVSSLPLVVRWFLSKRVRHATAMMKHVRRLVSAQRDILKPDAVEEITRSLQETRNALQRGMAGDPLENQLASLEKTASSRLKPYPNASLRENIEVVLVALAVAMGIRTFFLQPFKIPTGSMQPTLYGVTSVPDFSRLPHWLDSQSPEVQEQIQARDHLEFPSGWQRIKDWFQGISYLSITAENDGVIESIRPPFRLAIFSLWQKLRIAGDNRMLFFPPDYGQQTLETRAGIRVGTLVRKGQEIVRMKIQSGDHLFVDRLTYNFRKPKRGEIIVFETAGTKVPMKDTFYIKRLVALGGETVQIGDDRHLRINGERLDASTPHFENVYAFDPNAPPADSVYSGHVNQTIADGIPLAPLFRDENSKFVVPEGTLMVMGDNTMNSQDSRVWGEFPASKVIGKYFFVYWPLTERFGWGQR